MNVSVRDSGFIFDSYMLAIDMTSIDDLQGNRKEIEEVHGDILASLTKA